MDVYKEKNGLTERYELRLSKIQKDYLDQKENGAEILRSILHLKLFGLFADLKLDESSFLTLLLEECYKQFYKKKTYNRSTGRYEAPKHIKIDVQFDIQD